jgi:acetyl esterase/lipase
MNYYDQIKVLQIMKKITVITSLSLMLCLTMNAQPGNDLSAKPSQAQAKQMTTLTQFTNTADPVYMHDVVYRHASDMDLHLQVIMPQMAFGKKWPTVVYIQGSAWYKQDCYAGIPKLMRFAQRGYTVVSVEYRPSTTASYPAQIQDVKSAVRYVRDNATRLGVDTNNIFIWGDSSGGNMSLLETLTQDQPQLDTEDYGKTSIKVNACVAYYPVTDILALKKYPSNWDHESGNSPEGTLFGHVKVSENADKIQTASPVIYLDKKKALKTAPILIMTGNCDRVLPFEQSVEMADKLEELGYRYKFYKIEGGDHGSWQFWTPEAFTIVDNFLRANMKR